MRAIIQRVVSAGVEVEGRLVSEIGPGLLVLVGIHESDVEADADYISGAEGLRARIGGRLEAAAGWTQSGDVDEAPADGGSCRKVLNMRLFPNEKSGKAWDLNVMQRNFGVLLVSQFTLYGILKGNKPDFHVAMPSDKAKAFYASLVEKFQKSYTADAVKDGVFGAMMKVNLANDGPVTMQLDSSQSRSYCETVDDRKP
ncbi:hypothetical protein KSP39_PZI024189 [Platanthera zijinensis]|uniref:D-aminoacyl-tRNA deacylase n=1 Tax=Platanthera zijinensis TaxID=2320716 RepID=A0AAP0AT37_9ASPA